MTWHLVGLAVIALLAIALYINEIHWHWRSQERVQRLQNQLDTLYADRNHLANRVLLLCQEKASLQQKLRTEQQAYIFNLPTHIPGSYTRCRN